MSKSHTVSCKFRAHDEDSVTGAHLSRNIQHTRCHCSRLLKPGIDDSSPDICVLYEETSYISCLGRIVPSAKALFDTIIV